MLNKVGKCRVFFIFLHIRYYCFTRLPSICCHSWLFHSKTVVCFLLWLIIPMAKHFVLNFGVIMCNICWNLSKQFSHVTRHCSVGGPNL